MPRPRTQKRRAVIIGGSMSGLFSAAFLRRIGWEGSAPARSAIPGGTDAQEIMPDVLVDCVSAIKQPFVTPIYDFTAPRIVFGRVAMVGNAAANARPHMGFGVAKAGGDAEALANALRDHNDIDAALEAYNAERQPIGNTIVMHSRKLGTHLGVDLKTDEDRRMHALLQDGGAMLDWIAVPNFLDAYK
jgi:2-polyprenyl-6-methoxyphenol hydroxylase-like FAD-dependent oxidoreductase